jgi:putative oxidoreductase
MSIIAANVSRKVSDVGHLVLRLSFSLLMLTHGVPKLQQLVAGGTSDFPDPVGVGSTVSLIVAVCGEAVAPVLVMIGLFTRWAAVLPCVIMAVAAFMVHSGDPLAKRELALLYLAGFAVIALVGPGGYSIDGLRTKRHD